MTPTAPTSEQPVLPENYPLRPGLVIHPRDSGHQVVLEDSERGKFYRLGQAEGSFVAALIETGSPGRSHQVCTSEVADRGFSIEDVVRLCKWLATNGLVSPSVIGSSAPQPASPDRSVQNPFAAAFFWKIRLLNPDCLLTTVSQYFSWLLSPKAMLVGVAVCLFAVLRTSGQWQQFFASYENLFSSWRWITYAVGWLVLKVVHETAHGATCRRYGGKVPDAGLAMILLMPIAYVNVTSSWRFPSRWQRLHVTLAGVAAELFIAGLALIAWHWFDSIPLQQAAADVVMLASISSLLFNLNPLLKFDGYFALADVTGIDNLYTYGQRYARYFGGHYILGLSTQVPKLPGAYPGWIKLYGICAALYRVLTVSGLLVAAAAIFHGAGIVIAIAGAVSFVIKPLVMLARHLHRLSRGDRPDAAMHPKLSVPRMALRITCLTGVSIAPLFVIPANWSWTAPAIVQYDPPSILRTRSAGFIETIHAFNGATVAQGDPIVTLRNDNLCLSLSDLQKQLAQARQEILAAQWRIDSSALGDAQSREVGLEQQLAELEIQVSNLVLFAPTTGTLVSRQIETMQGTYVESGAELGVIGRENCKRLRLSVSQTDAKQTASWSDRPLHVIIDGQSAWEANLTRIESRADLTPPDPALLAINGGSLATIRTSADHTTLCEPRVNAYITLTPDQSRSIAVGRRAFVRIDGSSQSIGMAWLNLALNTAPVQAFSVASVPPTDLTPGERNLHSQKYPSRRGVPASPQARQH